MLDAGRLALQLWRLERASPRALASIQRERLRRLIAAARSRSRFYAALYSGLPDDLDELATLPPVRRSQLMDDFDAWITDPSITLADAEAFVADRQQVGRLFRGRFAIWKSSGSNGERGIAIFDRRHLAGLITIRVVRGRLRGCSVGRLVNLARRGGRVATVLFTRPGSAAYSAHQLGARRWPGAAQRLCAIPVDAPLAEQVRVLNAWQPAELGGYAGAIGLLADEQLAGRLQIQPSLVICGAEQLSPALRERIQRAFRCPVRDQYACAEAGSLANDCEHGRLHLNADRIIVEPVDASYRPVPPGQLSDTVLITDLFNLTAPLIRYDLGDRVILDPVRCPCGRSLPVISVEGRTSGSLVLDSSAELPIPISSLVLEYQLAGVAGLERFQILQTAPARLAVRFDAEDAAEPVMVWEVVLARLTAYLDAQGLSNVLVERSPDPPRPDPRTGKLATVFADFGSRQPDDRPGLGMDG